MASKIAKVVAILEGIIALTGLYICISSVVTMFTPQEFGRNTGEWSFLLVLVLAPLVISFMFAAIKLWKENKRCWFYQILPILVLIGIGVFFWWADRGSM